jgi:hypothetical protein
MDKSAPRGRSAAPLENTYRQGLLRLAARSTRKGAGEGVMPLAAGRHRQAKVDRPSAATCKRRKARHRCRLPARPARRQTHRKPAIVRNTRRPAGRPTDHQPLQRQTPPLPRPAHAAARAAPPAPASHRLPTTGPTPAATKLISPRPLRSTRISVKFPRGQPPPGNSASSSAWPLGDGFSGKPGQRVAAPDIAPGQHLHQSHRQGRRAHDRC